MVSVYYQNTGWTTSLFPEVKGRAKGDAFAAGRENRLKLSWLASRSYGMFEEPVHFTSIRIPVPRKAVYARMGFRKGLTRVSPEEQGRVDRYMDGAADIITLKGAARAVPVVRIDEAGTELSGGRLLPGRSLSRMLSGCSHVLLMGATAGPGIMEAITAASAGQDLTQAVVLDATASEMTDAALDWIMSYADQELRRSARRLTKSRYSAGYGDFPLESQRELFTLLRLESIGVALTESCILVPEKSVTAVAGIGRTVQDAR